MLNAEARRLAESEFCENDLALLQLKFRSLCATRAAPHKIRQVQREMDAIGRARSVPIKRPPPGTFGAIKRQVANELNISESQLRRHLADERISALVSGRVWELPDFEREGTVLSWMRESIEYRRSFMPPVRLAKRERLEWFDGAARTIVHPEHIKRAVGGPSAFPPVWLRHIVDEDNSETRISQSKSPAGERRKQRQNEKRRPLDLDDYAIGRVLTFKNGEPRLEWIQKAASPWRSVPVTPDLNQICLAVYLWGLKRAEERPRSIWEPKRHRWAVDGFRLDVVDQIFEAAAKPDPVEPHERIRNYERIGSYRGQTYYRKRTQRRLPPMASFVRTEGYRIAARAAQAEQVTLERQYRGFLAKSAAESVQFV